MDFAKGSRYIDDKAGVDKREGQFFLPGGPAASFDWRSTGIKRIITVKSTGYIIEAAAAQAAPREVVPEPQPQAAGARDSAGRGFTDTG
jgi:hypothetical protein